MIKVYNPIYDSVFKYLMEDERVSKIIQSKTHLNELLRLPDQTQAIEDKFIILNDNMDSSPEYQEIMKALIKATADTKVQGDINFEDEMEREFAVRDQAIVNLKAEVDEKAKQLTTTIQMLKKSRNRIIRNSQTTEHQRNRS